MVTVDALNRLIAATGQLGDARLSPLTADLAAETVKQTQRRFDRRTAPDGSRWKPRKDNLPHPLLEKSGRLRRSIGERDLQEKDSGNRHVGRGLCRRAPARQRPHTAAPVPRVEHGGPRGPGEYR